LNVPRNNKSHQGRQKILSSLAGLGWFVCPVDPALKRWAIFKEDAAPTGLGNFWFGFLQRCRAYGAGENMAVEVKITTAIFELGREGDEHLVFKNETALQSNDCSLACACCRCGWL
jgi:hypothetical protein